ncbi:acetyltransferase [Tepidicaulis sp. LMO-SS28]|uniref:acetyltransferase n=1 Tax=Tepidicaulis sp. LMO-SS28 TaxID=3447455 RepID=UPI003EE1E57C
MKPADITIIGAGGHAKVVASSWLEAGGRIAAILDANPELAGQKLLGHKVALQPEDPEALAAAGAILAIGDNRIRAKLARMLNPAVWQTVIHPRAYVHETAQIGKGSLICAGAVVQPDAVIGDHVIVNTGAVIEHDCRVGDFSHIGPTGCLGGGAAVQEGAFVGLGAKIIPLITVGAWAIVGAGAAVIRDVESGTTVAGVPAKPL